jgi:hypothetical protein
MTSRRPIRPLFDALEQRLVLSAGYEVGYRFAAPASVLNLGGTFNPSDQTYVYFTPLNGPRISEAAATVSSTSVTAAVPFAISPLTGQATTLGYHVDVVQFESGRGHVTHEIYHLQVEAPPATGLQPGTLLNAFLSGEQSLLSQDISEAQALGSLSKGSVNVDQEINGLQDELQSVLQEQYVIHALMTGQAESVPVGRSHGRIVAITPASLELGDQILAAIFSNQGTSVTTAASSGRIESSLATGGGATGYLDQIQQYFTNLSNLHFQVPTAAQLEAAEAQTEATEQSWTMVSSVIIAFGGVESVPALKIVGTGLLLYNTISPFFSTNGPTSASLNSDVSGEATPANAQQIISYLGKSALIYFTEELQGQVLEDAFGYIAGQELTALEKYTIDAIATNEKAVFDQLQETQIVTNETEANNSSIQSNLYSSPVASLPSGGSIAEPVTEQPIAATGTEPPEIGVNTNLLEGTFAQGTSEVTGSFTIENIGGGSLDVDVASDSNRIEFTTSQQGNVVTVSLTADTADLSSGSYQLGAITVTSPTAGVVSQTVAIDVVVTPSPSSTSFTPPESSPTYPVTTPTGGGSNSNPSQGSGTFYYVQYRFPIDPPDQFNYATGNYNTPDDAVAEFQQELEQYQLSGDPDEIPAEYQVVEVLDGDEPPQVIQDVQL